MALYLPAGLEGCWAVAAQRLCLGMAARGAGTRRAPEDRPVDVKKLAHGISVESKVR